MTDPTNPSPAQQPPHAGDAHRPKRKLATFTAVVLAGSALLTIGYATGTATNDSAAPSAYGYGTSFPLPQVSDFTIGVKILEKQCFGSAGCNIIYRIEPAYLGDPTQLSREYTVVYEVTGGEDGPQVNNFVVDSEGFRFQKEERTGTSSSGATLKAKATSVSED